MILALNPTLVDWYFTNLSGEAVEAEAVLREISRHGSLEYPEHKLGVTGKLLYPGDDREIAPACHCRILKVQCTGYGNLYLFTDRHHEFVLNKKDMLVDLGKLPQVTNVAAKEA